MIWYIRRFIYMCLFVICILLLLIYVSTMKMPGISYNGSFVSLTQEKLALSNRLYEHVYNLSGKINTRNIHQHDQLLISADYIKQEFTKMGYDTQLQDFSVGDKIVSNIIVEKIGTEKPDEILIVGAHYDSARRVAGANDNATGVASMLELAKRIRHYNNDRTIRFVAFVNEEPPYFQSEHMGSLVYAKSIKSRGDNVIGMISLETLGYYSNAKNSQSYPPPFNLFYPDKGNFIAFVANISSEEFVKESIKIFRQHGEFPSEGIATFGGIPGVGWSDHWSFWKVGYPAIMITYTAPFRYPYYHTDEDTIDKIDFESLTRITTGLELMLMKQINYRGQSLNILDKEVLTKLFTASPTWPQLAL